VTVVDLELSVEVLELVALIDERMQSITIITVLVEDEHGDVVVSKLDVLGGQMDMMSVEVSNDILFVDLQVANFDTSKIEVKISGGHLVASKFNLDEATVPLTLGQA
jgi:hypothetical protein